LPPERRREVWSAVEADRAAIRPLRQVVRDAREEARKALLVEPFDAARYAAAQKRLFDAEQEMRLRGLDVIQAIAQRLTPAERAAFSRWEEEDRNRRRAFWRGVRGGDNQPDQPRERGAQPGQARN
jgi:Spy/CpxP family protein refolding chaperone